MCLLPTEKASIIVGNFQQLIVKGNEFSCVLPLKPSALQTNAAHTGNYEWN